MRQAVEAQVLNPHSELGEHDLHRILTDVIEEVKQSVNQDIEGAEILHSLLNAPWLLPLLSVYECLQRFLRDSPAPALDYASGLSFQLLLDIRSLPGCSEEARELYCLLQQPHLQALLSAHDTVAQKDYDPVLPPMPDDVLEEEEATRIVCMVKNKQPLLCGHHRVGPPSPTTSPPCVRSCRGGSCSHWDTVRHLTQQGGVFTVQRPAAGRLDVKDSSWCSVRRGSYPPPEPLCHHPAARPCPPPPTYKHMSNCEGGCRKSVSHCRLCYSNLLWEQSLNRSAPSVCSSVLMDDVTEELDSGNDNEAEESLSASSQRWSTSPPCLTVPYCSNTANHLRPGLPPRLQSPRVRTAPPSPMRPRRVPDIPPLELAKQESLDELRSTVRLAACSMESSTKDIKLLGEKMAAATERMTETVQDNSQAVVLLTRVVDRLQSLFVIRTEVNTSTPADTLVKSLKTGGQHPPLTHQSRCSFPSLPSFTSSSSSLSSSMDAPSTSQGTSCLSASCRGTSDAASPHGKHTDQQTPERPLTNGLLAETKEASKAVTGGHTNQRKKRRKKDKRQRVSKEWTC